ncbi:hypothetical protein FZEAL_6623 [Fusarium zealandicum]|uniref:Uncharacterized protein n=1 Tax=Fusarium zealandicum TaxID=1053134 RepID=A0A8H4XJP6_9HYPO|nr:hypothetical protein FZEAL_6623 [Fusarium zealandicum]
MTSRNLNQTWRDVIFQQYAADLEADVPFPVSYLIFAREWNSDIIINTPSKIDLRTYKNAIRDFCVARRHVDPAFSNEYISVRARETWQQKMAAQEQQAAAQEGPDPAREDV